MRCYYVYIIAKSRNGTLYVGVTQNLPRRIMEHRLGLVKGFTRKYQLHMLVYAERYDDRTEALRRERRLKRWRREWKLALIESINPDWDDLYEKDFRF